MVKNPVTLGRYCWRLPLLVLLWCASVTSVFASRFPDMTIETVLTDIRSPWAMAQLADKSWLITERSGSILLLNNNGEKQYVGDIPPNLYVAGQGGLLDIALHPRFDVNQWVYITYSAGTEAANHLVLARARLSKNALSPWQVIFTVEPSKDTPVHYGGRIAFVDPDTLLLTTGDGFDYREQAQQKHSMLGKVLRLNADGQPHPSNPFYAQQYDPSSTVFSLGHRNPQGLVYDMTNDVIYMHEHGPDGGDEINILTRGANYGWPVVTLGKDYSGANISPFESYPGMQEPLVNWTPSIAPSSLVQYRGALFPELQGDLLIAALKPPFFHWVRIRQGEVRVQKPIKGLFNTRLRDVAVGKDGAIFILTDGQNASLLKMTPVN